jgi:phosphopantetheinyl transferase
VKTPAIEGFHIEFVPLRAGPPELPSPDALGCLAADEEAVYAGFSAPKRRRDWLAGRWAAKLVLARRLEKDGLRVPLREIAIGNDLEGAPVWKLLKPLGAPVWPLSITHSGGWAAAAIHTNAARLGVDLEQAVERDPSWIEVAFHPDERPLARTPEAATRLWTVKEAALKLLGIGLRADLWDVRVGGTGAGRVRLLGRALARHGDIGSPELHFSTHELEDRHVMTVAYTSGRPGEQSRAAQMGDFAWTR